MSKVTIEIKCNHILFYILFHNRLPYLKNLKKKKEKKKFHWIAVVQVLMEPVSIQCFHVPQ